MSGCAACIRWHAFEFMSRCAGSGQGSRGGRDARGGDGAGVVTPQHGHADGGPPDPLARRRDGQAGQVLAGWVDAGGVADGELEMDRRRDPDQLGRLVVADGAAEVVGAFDVDVQRDGHGLPDGGDLGQRQVDGKVDGGRAQVLQQPGGGRVGDRQGDRDLDLEVVRQVAGALHPAQHPELAGVGDQDAADAEGTAPEDVLHAVGELVGPAQAAGGDPPGRAGGLHADVPGGPGPDEQADLDALVPAEGQHLGDVVVGEQHHAAALADPVDPEVALLGRVDHRPERLRPLDRGDLDPVLGPVAEPLGRGRQLAQVPVGQAQPRQVAAGLGHGATFHQGWSVAVIR